MKICGKCKIEKSKAEFSKHSARSDGLQPHCKNCRKLHRAEKAKQISDYQKSYRVLYPGKRNEQQKRYAEKNQEKIAEYRAMNPEKISTWSRNRRSRLRGADGRHTASDVLKLVDAQRGLCANCKSKLIMSGANKFHIDHIVPLARGGSNWPHNLQCLCQPCNSKKSKKDPIVWAKENGRLL